ncbi:Phenylalanine--tRNA ligase, mitochondrial [Trichoplax sp. H2]|nr:Phenylalanine--tRNA ligase, mitochondrial [Trichoplax sp. H2]|eukprot:RDD38927.1 Phenylalanine--tRNA ligase, mitochondrial [Trichoplax sp. H2]
MLPRIPYWSSLGLLDSIKKMIATFRIGISARLVSSRIKSIRCHWLTTEAKPSITICDRSFLQSDMTNITPTISAKVGANLHCQRYHPLKAIKDHIEQYVHAIYRKRTGSPLFTCIDNLSPVVSVEQNFDSLSVPQDHVSRAKNDNYYINSDYLLRAHTSAHERDLVRAGLDAFLCTGDCYRRDEIDAKHYPVFHQMEGVRLFDKQDIFTKDKNLDIFDNSMQETEEKQAVHSLEAVKFVENDLKEILMGIMNNLFGNIETRFVDAYFPFTHPSWEMEIKFQGD